MRFLTSLTFYNLLNVTYIKTFKVKQEQFSAIFFIQKRTSFDYQSFDAYPSQRLRQKKIMESYISFSSFEA